MPAVPTSPVRILVKGSSTVSWISLVEPGRVSHAYPRALETAMQQHGWSTQVRVMSPLAASSLRILRDADDEIFAWDPDVIVLNTGHMETLHMVIPRAFARHVFTRTARPGLWRRAYRRSVLWAVYASATRIQARIEPMVAPWVFRRRRNKVIAHVNRYIEIAKGNGHPLVIVMGLTPPVLRVPEFPGLVARLDMMNEAFRALVEQRADPSIAWFDPSDALAPDELPPEHVIGDGMHFTAKAHEAVGKRLADLVEAWAMQQPHLISPQAEWPQSRTSSFVPSSDDG